MKKLVTKLMISVLSVALAFIALGTSTFAWFSMNTEVTASGMELTAATPVNLLICATSDGTYKNSATADEAGSYTGKLLPASSQYGVSFNAIQANQSLDNAVADDSLGGVVTTDGLNNDIKFQATGVAALSASDGYYATYDYYLKLSELVEKTYAYLDTLTVKAYLTHTVTAANVEAKASISAGKFGGEGTVYYTDTLLTTQITADNLPAADGKIYYAANENLVKAVRVAMYEGTTSGTLIGVYAPYQAASSYNAVTGTLVADEIPEAGDLTAVSAAANKNKGQYFVAAAAANTFTAPTATTEYCTTALNTTGRQITLVVWIEGQDPACINANAGVQLALSVIFKTVSIAA